MSQTSPLPIDWTEQRALWGYSVYVWQINLGSLLAVLFIAFVGFYFSAPFLPFLVRELGVTDPRAVAVWSGILIGLGPASAAIASPLWGRLADRIGGHKERHKQWNEGLIAAIGEGSNKQHDQDGDKSGGPEQCPQTGLRARSSLRCGRSGLMIDEEHIESSNNGQAAGTDEGRANAEVIGKEPPQGRSYH